MICPMHRRGPFQLILLSVLLCVSPSATFAQVKAGGGYAKVYEASGRSAAARGVQQTMNTTLLKAIAKSRSGKSTSPKESGRRRSLKRPSAMPVPADEPSKSDAASFTPDPSLTNTDALANAMGTNDTEREYLRQIFAATKVEFEKQVAAEGRQNNLAGAFTFFIASAVTVYHDDPEPSEESLDKLWDGLDGVFNESPDMAKMADAEKQQMYDTLVALSGLVLAGYMQGKTANDKETQTIYKNLAGTMIEQVLKTEPAKIRFGKEGLRIL
jgi:hypothetical protein